MSAADEKEVEQMRCALSAIANEMQNYRYQTDSECSSETTKNEDVLRCLVKCKSTLKLKNENIRLLRRNLRTICAVAKTLSSAKEVETASLNNQLNYARNQYWDLMKKQKATSEISIKLQAENQALRDKLQSFNNFIEIGYRNLLKPQVEIVENTPILEKLQNIIIYCGQYYADYCNQLEKCSQLEQKNRFLNSKLQILEKNLKSTSEQLRNNDSYSIKHKREKRSSMSQRNFTNMMGVVRSEYQLGHRQSITNLTMTQIRIKNHSIHNDMRNLDLTSHLTTVQKLLQDQDTLIEDLRNLSNEIDVES
ncbi:uncharacterized protein LOC142974172 [Anticarsia gemmatalis]|uniref:uncharacterized protein LOC142974172 n=1 Tax=Anticarsia gemmatalis TaxID=129554 RepID=UPI003F76970B